MWINIESTRQFYTDLTSCLGPTASQMVQKTVEMSDMARNACISAYSWKKMNIKLVLTPWSNFHPNISSATCAKQTSVMIWESINANTLTDLHYCERCGIMSNSGIVHRHKLSSRWHLSWVTRKCQDCFCRCFNRALY